MAGMDQPVRTGSSSSGRSDCAGRCRHGAHGCDLARSIKWCAECSIRGIIADIAAAEWSAAAEKIDELLGRQELGLHLINPWRVVVFGAPNVGKSSLINALAGFERAIVSPTPGTTRDVVTVTTAIEGWPVQFSDTAGFRETQDELESAGIELATTALSKAELAIFVHDAAKLRDESSDGQTKIELSQACTACASNPRLNKIDLITDAERLQLLQQFADLGTGNRPAACL